MIKEFEMFLKGHYKDLILNEVSLLDFCQMLDENFWWNIEDKEEEKITITIEHEKVVYNLTLELKEDMFIIKKTSDQ